MTTSLPDPYSRTRNDEAVDPAFHAKVIAELAPVRIETFETILARLKRERDAQP